MKRQLAFLAGFLVAATVGAAPLPALTHRVWLLDGVPDEGTMAELRAAGVDALVVPVGEATLAPGSCRLVASTLVQGAIPGGMKVSPAVWVTGSGGSAGDTAAFINQLTPLLHSLAAGGPLVLAARHYWDGLPAFAGALAKRLGATVEVALALQELRVHLPARGWPGVRVVAIAFGKPAALGFAASTLQDDLDALDWLDSRGLVSRVGVVVVPRASPPPGPEGASLATIALPSVGGYRPAEHGDQITLRLPVSWGGRRLDAGEVIAVDVEDTARYHRDLGLILRAARIGVEGWDTLGLPARAPALGMSREAFVAYLGGALPHPRPVVSARWTSAGRLELAVANPTP
ncbi:MAG: hypothetical protein V1750_09460, partial [Acidobacteriota bacterium]